MDNKDKILMLTIYKQLFLRTLEMQTIIAEAAIKMDENSKNDLSILHSLIIMTPQVKTVCLSKTPAIINEIAFKLKKFTEDNIKDIDIKKSNYFWNDLIDENFHGDTYFGGEYDYNILDVYDHYKSMYSYIFPNEELSSKFCKVLNDIIDLICEKYNEYMELQEHGLDIRKAKEHELNKIEEENEHKSAKIKEEHNFMTYINVVLPGILLAPSITFAFTYFSGSFSTFNAIFLVITILILIWFCCGIYGKINSCKKCGKWNAYNIVDVEILDTYVTTKMVYVGNSSTKVPRTVTMEKILETLECENCGDIKYVKKEREK